MQKAKRELRFTDNVECIECDYEDKMAELEDENEYLSGRDKELRDHILRLQGALRVAKSKAAHWQGLAENLQRKLGASDDDFAVVLAGYVTDYNRNLLEGEEPIKAFEMRTIIDERFEVREVANART